MHRHPPAGARGGDGDLAPQPAGGAGDEHGARRLSGRATRWRTHSRTIGLVRMNEPSVTSGPRDAARAHRSRDRDGRRLAALRPLHEDGLVRAGRGLHARDARQFGVLAKDGSDFVTAPELSPLFARALTAQIAESLAATGTDEVWEFGAGSARWRPA